MTKGHKAVFFFNIRASKGRMLMPAELTCAPRGEQEERSFPSSIAYKEKLFCQLAKEMGKW